jgi:hypothetical protein
MFNNSKLTSTPTNSTSTATPATARPMPSREAYDLAQSIVGKLSEAMALAFDPRDGDWSDYGYIVSLVARQLADAHPASLAAMTE